MRGVNAKTGKALSGLDHLRQSVRDILLTPLGSRVMRRSFGSRLLSLIDAPMNRRTLLDIYASTVQALNTWEPRLQVDTVKATKVEPGVVELTISGKYLGEEVEIVVGSPPVITSPTTAAGATFTAFSYQIAATGAPTSFYVVGGLPAGLTLNPTTGLIGGTPTAASNAVITVGAVNPYGSGEARVALSVVVGYQPETLSWAARVIARGGTYTTADLDAMDPLVRAYKDAGFTDSNARVNLFCGGDIIACSEAVLRGPGGIGPDVFAFNTPSYDRNVGPWGGTSSGIKGLTDDSLLITPILASAVGSASSYSLGFYNRSYFPSISDANVSGSIGTADGSSSARIIGNPTTIGNGTHASIGSSTIAFSLTDPPYRFICASRVTNSLLKLFNAGSLLDSVSSSSTALPNQPLAIGGYRQNADYGVIGTTVKPVAGYHMGPGLTDQQVADISTAWQTYATAMGRAV